MVEANLHITAMALYEGKLSFLILLESYFVFLDRVKYSTFTISERWGVANKLSWWISIDHRTRTFLFSGEMTIIGCLAGYDSLYSLMCPPPASIIRGSMVEDNGNIRIISEYEAEEKYTVNWIIYFLSYTVLLLLLFWSWQHLYFLILTLFPRLFYFFFFKPTFVQTTLCNCF